MEIPPDKLANIPEGFNGSRQDLERLVGTELPEIPKRPERIPSIPPQPKKWICDKAAEVLRQEIRITDVTIEKRPTRLIVTFENATGQYVHLKDHYMRIAVIDEDRRIKAFKHIKRHNSLGRVYLARDRDMETGVAQTVGVLTTSWYINRKRYDFESDQKAHKATFAASLPWFNPKTGERYYDEEKDSIVLLYYCDFDLPREMKDTFYSERGQTVRNENIIAEYSQSVQEDAPSAPSLITRSRTTTTWGSLQQSK